MKKLNLGPLALVCVVALAAPARGLDVTLDSGAGSITLVDGDLDGAIDFNTTVGGVLEARGRVFEQAFANTSIISLTTTPPFAEAFFHNASGTDQTFTITVNSSTFFALGPPLGWSVFYNGRAADRMGQPINIPAHSVTASINAGAVTLATVAGTAITFVDEIDLMASGVNVGDSTTDLRFVFTFTAGPDDEILLPDNNSVDGDAIQVSVFNQAFQCVDKMNNLSRKVLDKAQKSDAKCVDFGVRFGGSDQTACVDAASEDKTVRAEAKLLEQFDAVCAASTPPWGVNAGECCENGPDDGMTCMVDPDCPGGSCVRGACISGAAERAANDATHDLFGPTVDPGTGDVGKCQKKVIKRSGKLLAERWKVFRKCKKDNFTIINNDANLISTCLGPPQPDPRGSIFKRRTKLSDEVSKCVERGVNPVGPVFPGQCTGETNLNFATCVSERVSCRFCLAINVADDINPPLNCDQFDDGVANASCP
jgi:hypothetical protein